MRNFLDRLRAHLPAAQAAHGPGTRAISGAYAHKPMLGGRQTLPVNYNPFGLTGWYFIPKQQFQMVDVAELDVTAFTADQLLAILPDLSPDFGKAVWNFLRIAGTALQFTAVTPNGKEDPEGQKHLDDLVEGINPNWGGIDAVVRQLLLTAYLQGAVALDVAPTRNLKDLDDVFVVNPDTIYFERDSEQTLVPFQRQPVWGQLAAMPYREMNEDLFFYVPVDPFVDDPYGRAPAAPALQVVFAMAQVLRDLQKVIHHQGYPRLDFSVSWEAIQSTIPESVKADEGRLQGWVQARINEVAAAYERIAPEDAFIHLDYVTLNSQAAAAGSKLFDVAAVVHVFRQQLIEALKSLPIFHGENVGTTETWGSVEFEIYGSSVAMLREIVANPLARALTVGLNLRGRQNLVQHQWEPIRTTQRLADAQAEAQEIENEVSKRDQGWETQDDASTAITGSDAVAPAPAPAPAPMAPPVPDPADLPPDPALPPGPERAGALVYMGRGMEQAWAGAAVQRLMRQYGRR